MMTYMTYFVDEWTQRHNGLSALAVSKWEMEKKAAVYPRLQTEQTDVSGLP